jgi:hypothetical protein
MTNKYTINMIDVNRRTECITQLQPTQLWPTQLRPTQLRPTQLYTQDNVIHITIISYILLYYYYIILRR